MIVTQSGTWRVAGAARSLLAVEDEAGGTVKVGVRIPRLLPVLPVLLLAMVWAVRQALAPVRTLTSELQRRSADDLHIIYTGGTTGFPKGVMWRHEDFWRTLGGGIDFYTGEKLTAVIRKKGQGYAIHDAADKPIVVEKLRINFPDHQ